MTTRVPFPNSPWNRGQREAREAGPLREVIKTPVELDTNEVLDPGAGPAKAKVKVIDEVVSEDEYVVNPSDTTDIDIHDYKSPDGRNFYLPGEQAVVFFDHALGRWIPDGQNHGLYRRAVAKAAIPWMGSGNVAFYEGGAELTVQRTAHHDWFQSIGSIAENDRLIVRYWPSEDKWSIISKGGGGGGEELHAVVTTEITPGTDAAPGSGQVQPKKIDAGGGWVDDGGIITIINYWSARIPVGTRVSYGPHLKDERSTPIPWALEEADCDTSEYTVSSMMDGGTAGDNDDLVIIT